MPKLVVLLEQLLAPVPGGTGRYSRELTAALAATAPAGWTVGGAVARHADPTAAVIPGVEGPHLLPLPRRALVAAWDRRLLWWGVPLWPGGDAVHAPTPLAPPGPRRGCELVVTVHDTVPWTHPEGLTRRGVGWHRRMVGRAARRADALVVPTAAVAHDLPRHVPCQARVHVVGEGVTATVTRQPEQAAGIAARLGLPPRYVLAVGTLEPRKGIETLLAALAVPHAPDLPVVLVGQPGWGRVNPAALARRSGLDPARVHMLGRVTDQELAVVLHGAAVLAAPSLAEGFGLPVLEAMAAGVPVVHSDAPALVEVAGGAGVTVRRGDADGLAAALRVVLSDPGAARAMSVAGRSRAKRFSWERTARRVWAVHLELRRRRS
ncbi:MAG: glycosyltransferase family 4 protein [Pseudonocardiales bacterium]|nr:glycosyltransferase family 4 protein [Pseudonocardiales bacterium]MBV9031360.1 glycosyltransferase family 4 protein [Pseudonocardiales bacterium]MBW0011340.1 glycosyltransferase family 4 protein [Pseudonocardiales bacterium]